MSIFITILSFLVMLVIIFAVYILSKKFIFSKVKINKWIPLSISVVLFIVQFIAQFLGLKNNYISYGLSIFAVLFFLWFMDINQTGGPKKKEKQIVIRPKAKPNRVKKR